MASCSVNLYARVEFGHILLIAGATSSNCKNFKVNLTNGENEIPFTIFINLRLQEIVMNSYLGGEWKSSIKSNKFTIKPGEPFKIYIFAGDDKFHVALNNEDFSTYKYQTSLYHIKCIKASGDLEKLTQIDHRRAFPTPWPPIQEDISSVAFSCDTPHQFTPGSIIVLKMIVSGSADGSFFIRFTDRATSKQLFHFNPRFAEKIVVVNCMNDSLKWVNQRYPFRW